MNYFIAIDLGGTSIKSAIISTDHTAIHLADVPTNGDESSSAVISQLSLSLKQALTYANAHNLPIRAVGLGSPGIIDPTYRIVLGGADNITDWSNIPISDILESYITQTFSLSIPVFINNDANLMALGETACGAAKGCSDVIFLTIGTGVGGAMILNGSLYNGYQNRGGELGHIPLNINGEPCTCGGFGCFEQYASTSALVRHYKQTLIKERIAVAETIDGKYIVNQYLNHDSLAIYAMDQHCYYVARGVAAYINIFAPQKVIIGGGIVDSGPFYIEKIRRLAKPYYLPDCGLNTEILGAQLGGAAGCFGAAHWANVNLPVV